MKNFFLKFLIFLSTKIKLLTYWGVSEEMKLKKK